MRVKSFVLVFLLYAIPGMAQTPCSTPVTQATVNPGRFYLTSLDHMTYVPESTTEWLIQSYEIRYYREGAPEPFQVFTYPRAAFTAVDGVPDCYTTAQTTWPLIPNAPYRARAIAKSNPLAGVADSDPSEESNRFLVAGKPRPPVLRTSR